MATYTRGKKWADAGKNIQKVRDSDIQPEDRKFELVADFKMTGDQPVCGRPLRSRLQTAIVTGDIAALSSAQGVGNRTASRIVLDLKGKLDDAEFAELGMPGDSHGQVIAALTALGYSPAEARAAAGTQAVAAETEVDDRIRVALQQFATRS